MAEYFRPTEADMAELKSLYLECFDEDVKAAEYIFKNMLKPEYAFAARCGGEISSALYLLPCGLALGDGKTARAHYLMGAGTRKKFRGRGIMSGLIKYSNCAAEKSGDQYSVLLPASGGLYDYYAGLGYKKYFYSTYFDFIPDEIDGKGLKASRLTKISFDICSLLRFNICKAIRGSVCWDEKHIADCAALCEIYGGGILGCGDGYALYSSDDGRVFVEELICKPERAAAILLGAASSLGADRLTVRCPQTVHAGKAKPAGMILPLNGNNFTEDEPAAPYLGLGLD